jgi:hypothetical protein
MVANMRHGLTQLSDGTILTIPFDKVFDFGSLDILPPNVNEFTVGTTQLFPVGTRMQRDDCVYRYVKYGGTTIAAQLLAAEDPGAARDELDPTGSGTDYGTAGTAVGSTIISIATSISMEANDFVGGSLVGEDLAGEGYRYKILRNTAVSSAVNASIEIQTGLAVAVTSASHFKLIKSKWMDVVSAPTSVVATTIGVGLGVGADDSFGWAQTRGPAAVQTEGALTVGLQARHSETTAGTVAALDYDESGVNNVLVGRVMEIGATTEKSLIDLMLE